MSRNFWQNKKVLVTGGTGFVGSWVCQLLVSQGAVVTATTRKKSPQVSDWSHGVIIRTVDLLKPAAVSKVIKGQDIVLHLAAQVAGIQYNRIHPAEMFGDNVLMTKNVLDAAVAHQVDRVLIVSSACVYPATASIPTPEHEGFQSDPEPTNLGYGWAKRTAEVMARLYNQEYGLKIALARPSNTYGPRDDFDDATSHVIPSLIKRVMSGEDPLSVWGSGEQTRSFMYVADLAAGLLAVTEKYAECDPVNLGSSEETSIKDLVKLIIKYSKHKPHIVFDTSKPDGQKRRQNQVSKAKDTCGFIAKTKLETGIQATINWYGEKYVQS